MCFIGVVGLDEQSAKMEPRGLVVARNLFLGAAFVVVEQLICRALEATSHLTHPSSNYRLVSPYCVSPHDLIVSSILLFCPWRDLSK